MFFYFSYVKYVFFMSKVIKAIKIIIFCCFFLNIIPSISQTEIVSKSTFPIIIPLDNLVQYEKVRPIPSIVFKDSVGNKINLEDFFGNLIIINFWATWCKPCEEEMPSLDRLYQNENFKNLLIFPVNVENPNFERTKKFFLNLNIKKLQIFYDTELNFVKHLKLRGVPTTIFINKKGEEFARLVGSINFEDKDFMNWLLQYD